MRAALYVRASTEHQNYSTDNQSVALLAYAKARGYEIVRTYIDEGRSGLTLKGRPGLRDLLNDALSPTRTFQLLLVYDISRWGRFQDADESAHYEFLCKRAGIQVIYVAEPFTNDGTPLATVIKAIKRSMAAEYSRELSEKVAIGRRRLAAQGFCMAAPGYGLRRLLIDQHGNPKQLLERGERKACQSDRVVLVPGTPKEQATVRRIFRLFADHGHGFADIAAFLNKWGIPNNAGSPWMDIQVKTLLKDETYAGTMVFGRTRRVLKGRRENMPPETWIRCEGALPSIVPKRLFRRAQARMAGQDRAKEAESLLAPLRELYRREGYLTGPMIDAEPDMPNARSYKMRFGGLTRAYYLVGYVSPQSEMARWGREHDRAPDREAILVKLRALLDREGRLSGDLIEADPALPPKAGVAWLFGSLHEAYDALGYKPSTVRPLRRSRVAADMRPPGNDS